MKKYKLLTIINLYLIAQILIYFLGPLKWKSDNNLLLLFFMSINIIFLSFGYFISVRNYKGNTNNNLTSVKSNLNLKNKTITMFLVITLIMGLFTFYRNLNINSLNPKLIIDKIIYLINNPVVGYKEELTFGGKIYTYTYVSLSPILFSTFLIGIYYFRNFSKTKKTVFIIIIILEILSWLLIGTNKGIIDLGLITLLIIYLKKEDKTKTNKIKFKNYLAIVSIIIFTLFIFQSNIGSRVGDFEISSTHHYDLREIYFTKNMNTSRDRLLVHLSSYFTQGFYGLSLMFKNKSPHIFVFGNSPFLMAQVKDVFGINLSQSLLQYQNYSSTLWHPTSNWHSLYTSIANAYGFLFVPFIMMIYGYITGLSYNKFKNKNNLMDLIVLSLMVILFFYLPANNQIMSYPKTAFTFLIIMPFWLLDNKNIKITL